MPHQVHQQDPSHATLQHRQPGSPVLPAAQSAASAQIPAAASALDCASKFGYGLPGLSVEKEVACATRTDQRSLCVC
jgi:hypothetical protein